MTYEVEIEGRIHLVHIERADGGWQIGIDGAESQHVLGSKVGVAEWIVRANGRGRTVGVAVDGPHASLQVDGHGLRATVVDPRRKAFGTAAGVGEGTVVTPMPGVVSRVLVSVGDPVQVDQVLLVVEAMKMENEFRSPIVGTVGEVCVEPGQALKANAVLVRVEPES